MSTREKRNAEAKDRILDAAIRMFSKKGFHRSHVTDIAREAKTSAGTVYINFKDKYDIFQQITRNTMDGLSSFIDILNETGIPCDPREYALRWKSAYSAFFDYVDDHPDKALLILRGGFGVTEDHDTTLWEFIQSLAEAIGDELQKSIKCRYSREIGCDLHGHIIIGMCRQVTMRYIIDKQFSRDEIVNTLTLLTVAFVSLLPANRGRSEQGVYESIPMRQPVLSQRK